MLGCLELNFQRTDAGAIVRANATRAAGGVGIGGHPAILSVAQGNDDPSEGAMSRSVFEMPAINGSQHGQR